MVIRQANEGGTVKIQIFSSRYRLRSGYRFRLVALNGEIVAQSEHYSTKASALDTIKLIQSKASIAEIEDLT
jgi:uncharacterized protein YegP (UPF0339 family)